MQDLIIETTLDGSHTLFLPEINEHYHSTNGAIRESCHVYLESAFNQCYKPEIRVLELGFGTGLNVLLTALESKKRNIKTFYTSIEKYPLSLNVINQLNYNQLDPCLFNCIHSSEWETPVPLSPFISLQKINADFTSFEFTGNYDVVYYDAFAPDKQAEAWSQQMFDKIFAVVASDGILATYCAKGNVRRMMQCAGFTTERLPGPPGKREMLRARKINM